MWIGKKIVFVAVHLSIFITQLAWAGAQGRGAALRLSRPLEILVDALTGSVAFYVGVVAIASGGAILAFGADIDKAVQRLAWALMAVGLAVNAANIVNAVFAANI
ncbi:MAG: TrbC/VirB2 family protein [Myxococcales bacterium]|nr:TrbC/VirB2 family protein [Myxococcales bacterium]